MLARSGPPVGRLRAEPGDDDGNPERGAHECRRRLPSRLLLLV